MKLLLPVGIALLGLGAGVAAGLAFKPQPEAAAACEADVCSEEVETRAPRAGVEYVALDKPFIVPVFLNEKVAAMVVLSLSLEVPGGGRDHTLALQPRLRDEFLEVMFRHANSGGFDGSFTSGQKMSDLKAALLATAKDVMDGIPVTEVLVTEIVRQDV